jgi:hypothetical protein
MEDGDAVLFDPVGDIAPIHTADLRHFAIALYHPIEAHHLLALICIVG